MRPSIYVKEPKPPHSYCPVCGSVWGILIRFQGVDMFRCATCIIAIGQNVLGSGTPPPVPVPMAEWPEWRKTQVMVEEDEVIDRPAEA